MLNDNKEGIFCVMTSNNVQELPPELTRAGRLDGIFYFTLPQQTERKDILNIHFNKRGYKVNNELLKTASKLTKGYTGAELEQIVKTVIKKEYVYKVKNNKDKVTITEDCIKEAIKDVVPLSKSSREKINALETWANGRAIYANGKIQVEDTDIDNLEELNII